MVCQPMPPSEPLRIFISYARKDGAALAQRLQSDLANQGFDAWHDIVPQSDAVAVKQRWTFRQ